MTERMSQTLLTAVADQIERPVSKALSPLIEGVHARFGSAVQAMVFYGSCLRDVDPAEGIVDLYVLVDSYRRVYERRSWRLANAWLPPNVFYLEVRDDDNSRTLRAKCAVISVANFEHGCARAFQSYLWGRFAQPCRLVFSCNQQVRNRLERALAHAVLKLWGEALPCLPRQFDAQTGWQQALTLSYGVELRPEGAGRPAALVTEGLTDYFRLTHALTQSLPELEAIDEDRFEQRTTAAQQRRAKRRWRWRRRQGRVLHIVRLMKSFGTFEGGIDYIAWKLRRHTGYSIDVTPRLRAHPLIFGWPVLWRLLRDRVLR